MNAGQLRTLTSIAWVPLNLGLLYIGREAWLLWVAILAIAATSEILNLLVKAGRPPLPWVGPAVVFAFVVGAWAMPGSSFFYLAGPMLVITLLLLLLSYRQANAFERWGLTTAACLYTSFLAAYMILLRNERNGLWWMGAALTGTWVFDTGAYLVGRRWGKRRLWPAISPGKTWEGTLAGTALAAGLCLAAVRVLGLSYPQAIGLGVLIAVLAQLGDLVESAIKRQVGVKDAGSFLPGHGGILDRIDGLLFSTVGVYYFALLAGA
ncbi:MAG TPA: phosphatidate cytidylyltransferase [Chloroflexota bacterium]|nr:phosphatidate cytidylyltransferase [Chloroflexota bacterium]